MIIPDAYRPYSDRLLLPGVCYLRGSTYSWDAQSDREIKEYCWFTHGIVTVLNTKGERYGFNACYMAMDL